MRVADVRQWQWVVIGLLAGGIVGGVRQYAGAGLEDEIDRHGKLIADPHKFEVALLTKVRSQPLLKDVTVYPYWIKGGAGGKRLVHIVSGRYWDGKPVSEGGQMVAKWVPACFLAQVPFEPRHVIPSAESGGKGGAAERFDSVLDYLALLERQEGVSFRYAWWWWAREPLFGWPAGTLFAVGVVWPALINLVTFGTILRPPEERGVSLWSVRARGHAKPVPAPARSSSLDAIERELESHLGDASGADAVPPAGPFRPRAITVAPVEPAPGAPREAQEFRTKADDYYPTAVTAKHPKLR
jgi:hypothetical protein